MGQIPIHQETAWSFYNQNQLKVGGKPLIQASLFLKKENVFVHTSLGIKKFDGVIMASHADQSYDIIKENFTEEANLLKDFKYQKNTSILHSDINFMPKRKSVWSSWNYITETGNSGNISITYWMNELQKIKSNNPILLSLNPKKLPDPNLIYGQYSYSHPILDNNAIKIQNNLSAIQGKNKIWFCGAWTGFGFHEDGIKSAVEVSKKFNIHLPWLDNKEVGLLNNQPSLKTQGL